MDNFIFKGWNIGDTGGKINFHYELLHGKEQFLFTETLILPRPIASKNQLNISSILDFLLLVFGISYWKTFCPTSIKTPTIQLSQKQAEFWNKVYTKGLGEFFYKNKIDFKELVQFPVGKTTAFHSKVQFRASHRALVLIGGGKDSFVSAELVRRKGGQFSFFSLGEFPLIKDAANAADADLITIGRQIDPQLLELNKQSRVLNGHVPISIFYVGTAMLCAILYGFDEVVLAAEHSADYGNVLYLNEMVNHQWSKSEEAEKLLDTYFTEYVTSDVKFHSLIRKFSELEVASLFSKYPQYFGVFSSCNKNFFLAKKAEKKWCGSCPKCAFVFAILSPFLPKMTLVSIFGKNMFTDDQLLPMYRELLGYEAFKPFECVGTAEETKLAFLHALKNAEYTEDVVMKQFVSLCSREFDRIAESQKELLPHYENSRI